MTKLLDIVNPPGMFLDGSRLREHNAQDLPPFSGRLLPEFNNRRSIKDMFTRKPSLVPRASDISSSLETPLPSTSQPISMASNGAKMPTSSQTKKRNATEQAPTQASKRAKPMSLPSAAAPPKGQTTMRSFFSAKPVQSGLPSTSLPDDAAPLPNLSQKSDVTNGASSTEQCSQPPSTPQKESIVLSFGSQSPKSRRKMAPYSPNKDSRSLSPAKVASTPFSPKSTIDPVAAKEQFAMLFTKKPPPRCEGHDEPCKSFKTLKKGANQGREFWICARPLGPSGDKERGTEWRCPTFIWASDHKG